MDHGVQDVAAPDRVSFTLRPCSHVERMAIVLVVGVDLSSTRATADVTAQELVKHAIGSIRFT
jgi:hypothetical protein